jgi:hypothetical protein
VIVALTTEPSLYSIVAIAFCPLPVIVDKATPTTVCPSPSRDAIEAAADV